MLGVAGAACLASPEHTDPPGADSAPSAADARASCADPPPGGGPCDNLCSSCTEEICEMDCSTGPACGLVVVCPDGLDCRVDCTGKDRCISVTCVPSRTQI